MFLFSFKRFNRKLFQHLRLPVPPSLLSHIFFCGQVFLSYSLLLFLLLGKSGDFSGWRTWWILCFWVSGFCCLPLKRVGCCSENLLNSLWIIWLLTACFWDLLGQLWSSLYSGDNSAWIFRCGSSGVPPNVQWLLRTHHSCFQSLNISCPMSELRTIHYNSLFVWLCELSYYVSKALYS